MLILLRKILIVFCVYSNLLAFVVVKSDFNHRNVVHGGTTYHHTITLSGQLGITGLSTSNMGAGESLIVYPQSGAANNQSLIIACDRRFSVHEGGSFSVESVNGHGVNVVIASTRPARLSGDISIANESALLFLNAPFDENWALSSNPFIFNLPSAHSAGRVAAVTAPATTDETLTSESTNLSGKIYSTSDVSVMQVNDSAPLAIDPLQAEEGATSKVAPDKTSVFVPEVGQDALVLEENASADAKRVLDADLPKFDDTVAVAFFDEIEFEAYGEDSEQLGRAKRDARGAS